MARVSPRIGWTSAEPEVPDFDINAKRWSELETAFGQSISDNAREDLIRRCRRYFYAHRLGRSAAREKDVAIHAKRMSDDFSSFIRFAYGETQRYVASPSDDAWREFESRFSETLSAETIGLGQALVSTNQDSSDEFVDTGGMRLHLSTSLLMEVAIRLQSVLDRLQAGPGDKHEGGFVEGEAFRVFLRSMRNWAKNNTLPISPFVFGRHEAGPLACLIFELNRGFPDEFRKELQSAKATAMQIERAEKERPRPLDVSK